MKKKFKILILAISIIAMLCIFAISSSALEALPGVSDIDSICSSSYFSDFAEAAIFIEGNASNIIGNGPSVKEAHLPYGDSGKMLDIISVSNIDSYALIIDIEDLRDFCTLYDLSTYSAFYTFVYDYYSESELEGVSSFVDFYFLSLASGKLAEEAFYYMNNGEITLDTLEEKYDEGYAQGETDGVTEYKESEEYASVLLTKYNDGFVAGTAEGALAYAKSEAYKTALAEEYDKGYDDGFVEGEAQIDVAPIIGIVVVLGFGVIALVVLKVVQKRKHR